MYLVINLRTKTTLGESTSVVMLDHRKVISPMVRSVKPVTINSAMLDFSHIAQIILGFRKWIPTRLVM